MRVIGSESFSGWRICDGAHERLVIWLPSSKTVNTELMIGQIDFSADETMRPKGINEITTSLDLDLTKVVGATQVDDGALERKLVIGFPVLGEGTSWGSGVNPWRSSLPCCESKAIGTSLDSSMVIMHESLPDLLLPAPIEALDDCLEAGFMGWGENRGHAELQAQADDTPKRVRKLPCSAKDGVVVELGIFGESVSSPVSNQGLGGGLGGPRGSDPAGTKACLHADTGQDVDFDATEQTKVFDEVEAIDVRQTGSDAWEVPAFGRGRPPHSSSSIESAAPQEDSSDGTDGRNLLEATFFEGELDRDGAILAQVTLIAELLADSQDQIFHAGRRSAPLTSSASWQIAPGHSVNTLTAGALSPALNGSQCHTKFLRH